MAVVEGRVPGGRQRTMLTDELTTAEDDEAADFQVGMSPSSKNVSQSLPRFGNQQVNTNGEQPKTNTLPDHLDRPYKSDGKKKSGGASFRLGHFVQKMVRQMSIHSPKTRKKAFKNRSHSVTRESESSHGLGAKGRLSGQNGADVVHWEKGKVPGLQGIRNHGNTCFMNAVIQCLGHTDLLVEYFVTDHYKHDIKRNNKQNARKYGTKGDLTEHLAVLLKSIWTLQYASSISSDFKAVVGKYGTQYKGYAQHDAQEFLMWLLDKVHEDLNVATKKKYKPNKSHSHHDDISADILANHMRSNNSYVYDLFQAVYRSTLTCPNCRRQSNTYDPFLSISLPIPQKTKRPIYVTVVYLDAQPKQVQIGLLMDQCDYVRDLRLTLASDTKIPECQILLTEIYADGFNRTFHDSQPLSDIQETDNVYAIETPEPVNESDEIDRNSEFIILVVLNTKGAGDNSQRFGSVLVLQVSRETSYTDLQNAIIHHMITALRDSIVTQRLGVLFRLRVIDGLPGQTYLEYDVEHPLYTSLVERALSCCVPGSGPEHVKIIAEWDPQTKASVFSSADDVIEEHASVRQVQLAHEQPVLGTLDECFQLYTQDERLNGDDAWHCPNCRCRQQGTIKSISLWSLPDILVIHLKRFKQEGVKRNKLNTLITFPITSLDMSHHLTQQNNMDRHSIRIPPVSPWQRNKQNSTGCEDNLFDLYAVCNHYGNMQGGHYTAFCKNIADNKWYTFDDTKVTEMPEEEVVTRAAYLLFYQRRSTKQCNISDPNHWIHVLPRLQMKTSKFKHSRSHEDLLDDAEPPVSQVTDFTRNVQAYATLRTSAPRMTTAVSNSGPQISPLHSPSTPVSTHGLTVGQLTRQREQKRYLSNGVPSTGFNPKPGTPSSIRSTESDYDNLSPQFENTNIHSQTLPRHTHSVLTRQCSSPGQVIRGSTTFSTSCVKSPSYDFNFGTKKPNSVRVTPLNKANCMQWPINDASNTSILSAEENMTPSPPLRNKQTKPERRQIGLRRSLTSPEVLNQPNIESTSKNTNRRYQQNEHTKIVFLQESCV